MTAPASSTRCRYWRARRQDCKIEPVISGTREEFDASGKSVTPGFVDVHTHYDGSNLGPAPDTLFNLGTTTVVVGNCGVGFAPCRPEDRETLVQLMEGVEEIPGTALAAGIPWTWESFPIFANARRH